MRWGENPPLLFLNRDVVLRFEPQFYSTYAAFDYRRMITRFYDAEQFKILQMLELKPSEPDELRHMLNIDGSAFDSFLKEEIRVGFITDAEPTVFSPVGFPARPGDFDDFPAPFLSAPTTVDLFLTRTCNLRCRHCFASAGRPLPYELSNEEWILTLDQLEAMRVLEVRINGGEPLMRRDILGFLRSLRGRRFHKLILTNGTMLTDGLVDELVQAEITPTVSLDGISGGVHDRFRGVTGAYERALKGIQLLISKAVTFGLNSSVHSGNIGQEDEMVRLAIKMGAARIGFLGLQRTGRLRESCDCIVSDVEYIGLSTRLLHLAAKYRDQIEVSQELFPSELPLSSVGAFTCSVDSDGSVYPANYVLGDPRFRVGCVRNQSLNEIWFSKSWIPYRKGVKRKRGTGLQELSWRILGKAAVK